MKWKSFGASGLKVTELCLGTMTLAGQADEQVSFAILDAAHAAGIRFLDTADSYPIPISIETGGRTEELIGRWLKARHARDEWVIATKSYFPMGLTPLQRGNSRVHIKASVEASLNRLGTDRIDLFLCHGWDPTVPIDETLRALDDLRREGKIHHAGVSNVRAAEVAEALVAATRMGMRGVEGLEPRYNLLYREAEESLFPVARRFGLGTMVYNPLAGGLLSGKHKPGAPPAEGTRFTMGDSGRVYRGRYWNEDFLEIAKELKGLAEKCGMSLVTAAVAWTIANPDVTSAIIGVSKPEQLKDQIKATETGLPAELKKAMDAVWFDLPRKEPSLDTPRLTEYF